jgi:hypothetical protein
VTEAEKNYNKTWQINWFNIKKDLYISHCKKTGFVSSGEPIIYAIEPCKKQECPERSSCLSLHEKFKKFDMEIRGSCPAGFVFGVEFERHDPCFLDCPKHSECERKLSELVASGRDETAEIRKILLG